jgi:hypothetical protein
LDDLCFYSFVLALLCSFLVPRCIDSAKLRQEDDTQLKQIMTMGRLMIPRRLLTPTGAKLWMARNILLGIAVALAFWMYFSRS